MSHENELTLKLKQLVEGEDPLVQQVVSITLDEVNQRSLSIEATGKRVERKIDQLLKKEGDRL
ncbi:hypothetical protein [Halobacillus sp. Nhm2S1]|uniref:hypothetical protein n=1 Tax=Halobacillus sp. Nhm2S1 TaxID=2866716 RepID=UPI001C737AE3|nr:hypothetical protein [Halobacillus sp. Nhm2S1]MBX0358361.1 hypothetical protein [Halobacillus sp. Nhm2S1]